MELAKTDRSRSHQFCTRLVDHYVGSRQVGHQFGNRPVGDQFGNRPVGRQLDLAMTTNRAAVGESDEIDYLRSATKLTNYQISKGIQPE